MFNTMQKYTKFFIDGQWVAPALPSPSLLAVVDPATEQPFAQIAMGSEEDVDLAVQAASKAFLTFSNTSIE